MDRNELLTSIARAAERVERAQTQFEKEKHQTRLDELRAQLRKMDEPPPRVEDPRVPEFIAEIRKILEQKKGDKNGKSKAENVEDRSIERDRQAPANLPNL